jgi:hypothetical protein
MGAKTASRFWVGIGEMAITDILRDIRYQHIALGFHTSLHGTATEEKVAWWPVNRTKPDGQEGSSSGWI